MVPNSLPELPKPSRNVGESQKPAILNWTFYTSFGTNPFNSLFIPLKGLIRGPLLTGGAFLGTPQGCSTSTSDSSPKIDPRVMFPGLEW